MNELWVGFDEAGLGPILGPLSLSIFTTSKTFDFPILDSKKVHKKGNLKPLKKRCNLYCPNLKFLNLDDSIADLNTIGCTKEPWLMNESSINDEFNTLFHHQEDDINLYSRLISVGDYNKVLSSGLNKADTVLHFMLPMIQKVIEESPNFDRVNLMFDRLGGRKKYRPILEKWGLNIASSHENPDISRYYGNLNGQPWDIGFRVKGDLYHHSTAAASLFAKLRRELAMERMNKWWSKRIPGLKSTAGYWTDGLRFLNDIDLYRSNHNISDNFLRRNK